MAHGHAHAGHAHAGHAHATGGRRLGIALGLILTFMAVEVSVGIAANSLALLSDAAHMLTDAGALALSLFALRLAARPATGVMTYGFKRAEILSAQANGVSLLVFGVLIVYEACRRLVDPPSVDAVPTLAVALAGIAVNLAAVAVLHGARSGSLNIEGSYRHLVTDLFAFIATAIAAVVILRTGFDRADPIASLLVAASMLWAAYGLLRDSARIFLEAAPAGFDPDAIGRVLVAEPGVVEVHDLHVWELTSGFPVLTAHVTVSRDADCHATRRRLDELISSRFGIDHTTLQVSHTGDELLQIEPLPAGGRGRRPAEGD
jgi:cobalt-zinc-cadmium efflux system protein